MPIELPLLTRREVVREYRAGRAVTEASAIRSLRAKHVLSDGLAVEMRGGAGRLGGRLHIYSALNRDAVRALRRRDEKLALRLTKAASRLERAPETRRLAAALATAGPFPSTAALAHALSASAVARDVALVEEDLIKTRTRVAKTFAPTVLAGHIAQLDPGTALLKFPHHGSLFPMPRLVVEEAGIGRVGAAVCATWEVLPEGRTLITIEPAVDSPELSMHGAEPLVDMYGTPWGRILSEADSAALEVVGQPTIAIPEGIPDVP